MKSKESHLRTIIKGISWRFIATTDIFLIVLLITRAKYTIIHTSNEQKAMIKEIVYKVHINTYSRIENDPQLNMNDIARVTIKTMRPLIIDEYRDNRVTGSFVLIDDTTHETVAAGMIV